MTEIPLGSVSGFAKREFLVSGGRASRRAIEGCARVREDACLRNDLLGAESFNGIDPAGAARGQQRGKESD